MNTCLSISNTKFVGEDSSQISRALIFPSENLKQWARQKDSRRIANVCNYISSHLSAVKINQYHIQMYILMSKCFWTLKNDDIYQQWIEKRCWNSSFRQLFMNKTSWRKDHWLDSQWSFRKKNPIDIYSWYKD